MTGVQTCALPISVFPKESHMRRDSFGKTGLSWGSAKAQGSLGGLEQRRRVGNFLGNVVANRERGLVHFYLIVPGRIFEHRAHGSNGLARGVVQRYRHFELGGIRHVGCEYGFSLV